MGEPKYYGYRYEKRTTFGIPNVFGELVMNKPEGGEVMSEEIDRLKMEYEETLKALDLKYAEALMPNKNRLITFAEAEKMVEQAKQEIMDMLRKSYGGL